MRVTLHDVSREAGVSVGAVSQVLNNHPNASTLRRETRQKILDTVKRLGYRRNQAAVETRTGVVKTIAMVCKSPGKSTTSDNEILLGVIQEASRCGYDVKLFPPTPQEQIFESILTACLERIICLTLDDTVRERIQAFCTEHNLQLCFVLERSHGNYPVVTSSDRAGMRDVVRTLVEAGHRRIALINAGNNSLFQYKEERASGYLEGMKEAGLKVQSAWISDSTDKTVSVQDIARMIQMPERHRPTAFCCVSDSLGAAVINTAIRMGFRVPDDISVVGFGNSIPLPEDLYVPLTSVDQQFERIGSEAFRVLYDNNGFKRKNVGESYIQLPTKLILRESVKQKIKERRNSNAK